MGVGFEDRGGAGVAGVADEIGVFERHEEQVPGVAVVRPEGLPVEVGPFGRVGGPAGGVEGAVDVRVAVATGV
ncbi:hypothetical protein R589_23820, partial [Salmonella enterica subsp. enterica serovar Thompson]